MIGNDGRSMKKCQLTTPFNFVQTQVGDVLRDGHQPVNLIK